MSALPSAKKSLLVAILAGIGASACCIAPLLLLSLGLSGAWVGNLTAMEPYSGYFTAATIIMLAIVFHQLYMKSNNRPQPCAKGSLCENPNVLKNQRIIFWVVSIILLAMVSFPYYAEYLLG
ncbi:MAG: mercury transporter MerT [Colwellia sp.]|nr:mercury transporter MerT [Colwellia sp.]